MLVSPRKRGLIAPTTTNSTTIAQATDDLLAIGRDEAREAPSAGPERRRSRRSCGRLRVARPGHRRADRFRRSPRPGRTWRRCGRRSSPAPGRSCRAPPAVRWRSSGSPCPRCASLPISAWISALAPTSMPRVGSSMMRMRGSVASHLPSTTFCWLPPDSCADDLLGPARADAELLDRQRAPLRLARRVDEEAPRDAFESAASEMFSAMVSGRISPCRPRSSGT